MTATSRNRIHYFFISFSNAYSSISFISSHGSALLGTICVLRVSLPRLANNTYQIQLEEYNSIRSVVEIKYIRANLKYKRVFIYLSKFIYIIDKCMYNKNLSVNCILKFSFIKFEFHYNITSERNITGAERVWCLEYLYICKLGNCWVD